MNFRDGLEPYGLPNTGAWSVEDVRRRVGLLAHYNSQIKVHVCITIEGRDWLTRDITLRVGRVVDKDHKLVGTFWFQILSDIQCESEISSSIKSDLLALSEFQYV